jgi:hypothetical protein
MAGVQQIRAGSRAGSGCVLIVLGAFSGGIGAAFALGTTLALWDSIGLFTLIFAGVGGLFAVGGLVAVISGIRSLWLSRVLGRMTLELPQEQWLSLGGIQVVRFRRTGGSARATQAPTATAELSCHESATYSQGTDDHTVRHEVFRGPLTVFPEPVPGSLAGRVEIVVPLSYPPSMSLPHNRIVWELTLRVRVAGVPDDVSTFPLPVVPQVAERALRGGGPQ